MPTKDDKDPAVNTKAIRDYNEHFLNIQQRTDGDNSIRLETTNGDSVTINTLHLNAIFPKPVSYLAFDK